MPWEIIPGIQAYKGEEITSMTYNPKEYWLKPLIPKLGKTITTGKGKVGKTTFVGQLCFGIVRGEEVLGYQTERATVLYITFEPISHKVGRLLQTMPGSLDGFTVVAMLRKYMLIDAPKPKANKKQEETKELTGYEALDGMIEKVQPNIVVIDPLRYTMKGDIKDDQECAEWTKAFDRLQEKYKSLNLSFVIIGHEPKRGLRNPVDRPFGSMVLGAWADVLCSITQGKDRSRRLIEMVTRHEEEPAPLELEFHGVYSLARDKAEKKEQAKAALRELKAAYPDMNVTAMVKQVANETEISESWVWEAHSEIKDEDNQGFFGHLLDGTEGKSK